jgi:hypothetical protein
LLIIFNRLVIGVFVPRRGIEFVVHARTLQVVSSRIQSVKSSGIPSWVSALGARSPVAGFLCAAKRRSCGR